jgi:hypothetical protein
MSNPSHILLKLLQTLDEGNTLAKLEQILKTTVHRHQNRVWNEVLVKWKHPLVKQIIWENETKLKANFIDFCHWGQWPFFLEGEHVNNQMKWHMDVKNCWWNFETRDVICKFT